jgi:hypothetical protein
MLSNIKKKLKKRRKHKKEVNINKVENLDLYRVKWSILLFYVTG